MFMFMMNLSQLEGKLTEDSSGEFLFAIPKKIMKSVCRTLVR